MSAYRLDKGGLIDRSRKISFTFDGKGYSGFAGDTLASALLASDEMVLGRSFKYHRPRGLVTAGAAEPNALVTVGKGGRREPNARATMVELHDGLIAESQNRWPSLKYDIGSLNSLLSPFLGAGFYYKTFMWPKAFWEKVYEPFIRKAAGLGKLDIGSADPDGYEKCWSFCDLLVIGAGPAGLSAALAAARAGLRVILADEGMEMGGSLLSMSETVGGVSAPDHARAMVARLASFDNVQLLPRTTVFGWYDNQVFGAVERVQKHVSEPDLRRPVERIWRIATRYAVLASGAEERPLVFGGNDRPGVMMAGAMRTYLNRFGVAAGKKVAIFTNGNSTQSLARDLTAKGAEIVAYIDSRSGGGAVASGQAFPGGVVTSTKGTLRLSGISVDRAGYLQHLACDALAMSGGFSPVVHLLCQRGAKPVWSDALSAFVAPDVGAEFVPAGAANGIYTTVGALRDGWEKAARVIEALGRDAPAMEALEIEGEIAPGSSPVFHFGGSKYKAFVDFQNDVHVSDLAIAVREGFGNVEHAKRYTTSGMATDQGKLGNVNASAIIGAMRGLAPGEAGTTTFRPFYTPVSFGVLAGAARFEHARPIRISPLDAWARKRGAVMVEAGLWYRSSWFPKSGEKTWRESVDREVMTVRSAAGLCDVSTLGKIEVAGPDAAEFLNRIYSNAISKLAVGKARYGLMLREDGMVMDDGTLSRLGENHFFLTTTTGAAGAVMQHMEFFHHAIWPDLDVRFVSVTDEWAQMSIAGPNARKILESVVKDDLSDAAFPFMAAREVELVSGLRARLYRISFSGELAYEIGVPAGYGEAVADLIMEAGASHGICAYGLEALNVMRIEKGHVTHAELDGRVTGDDVGLGRLVSQKKADFVGKRLLDRFGLKAADRPQLVGLKPVDAKDEIKAGAHILKMGANPSTPHDQGWVSSACYSPTLGHMIALGFVKAGQERMGEKVVVWDKLRGLETEAVITSPVFVDPEHSKLKV